MDLKKIARHTRGILKAIGENPNREGLKNTPERVAKSYRKLCEGYKKNTRKYLTVFDNDDYDGMIILENIEFYSLCEHHILPFFGTIHIGYIPDKKIVGVSKLPRWVEVFCRRLQTQENLTQELADEIERLLQPKGVGVAIRAKHLCMAMRGVEKKKCKMRTQVFKGELLKNLNTRLEFLQLIKK